MPNWSHSKKQVREALDEARQAGFDVQETVSGHRWGLIRCIRKGCGQGFSVWSTPRDSDVHAKQIRHFMKRHSHTDEEGEG